MLFHLPCCFNVHEQLPNGCSPPISPSGSDEMKVLHYLYVFSYTDNLEYMGIG